MIKLRMPRHFNRIGWGLIFALALSACAATPPSVPPAGSTAAPVPQSGEILAQPIPTATYIPAIKFIELSVWMPPYLAATLAPHLPEPSQALLVSDPATASLKMDVGEENVVANWVYALVTPFPTTTPGVSREDVLRSWQGEAVGPFAGRPILLDQSTYDLFGALWGPAAPTAVRVVAREALLEDAWSQQPAWAIVPFDTLEPRWKVLAIDGLSPIHKDFSPETYLLRIPISLTGEPAAMALAAVNFPIPPTNRDPHKLTVVAMTGVTALVRATAFTMEQQGITYPAQDIRDWLIQADITHISNEVPFAEACPYPDPVQPGVRFCSRDPYIQLLEDIGTDVLELTGDHFHDWGAEAMFHTLDLYRQRGWRYYGGGIDLAEGRKALLLDDQANRIAFIGCNAKGGSFAQASDSSPGSVACDLDWMAGEVGRLRQEGYLVIATFQHHEYYMYTAAPDQQRDFRQLAAAGAVIVSGSQAHQPQSMEFLNGSFIHYGLGNLFFDQYSLCPACREALIDRHVFYNGRYISTELLPIQFIDYARPRPMTLEEANNLLRTLFGASGW